MSELIRMEESNGVVTLTLHRPDKLNAFGDDMREQLVEALGELGRRSDIRVLVITGSGRAFSAGGDVHHMVELVRRSAGFEALEPLLDLGQEAIRRLTALPFPTVASINGVAAGAGLNLALACDLRIASDQARFGETFVRIGLHPDWGGTYHLPRLVGLSRALEMCWLGEMIDAAEALRIALVNRVVPHDHLAGETATLAARLAAMPRACVRLAKQNLRAAFRRTLDECLAAESDAQSVCWQSADVVEGLEAFAAKREPQFGRAPDGSAREEVEAAGGGASRFE